MPAHRSLPEATMTVVAKEIRRHATRRGVLLADVLAKSLLNPADFAAIMEGKLVPTTVELRQIARALRVEADELVFGEDGEIDGGTALTQELAPLFTDLLDTSETERWSALVASILRLPIIERQRLASVVLAEITGG
jgi:transcriptional regulator with XRE-family HTH domain